MCAVAIICGYVWVKIRLSNQSDKRHSQTEVKNLNQNVIALVESAAYGSSLPQDDPQYESISCYLSPE